MAAATVRQVHAILRRALGQAARWGWIMTNPRRLPVHPELTRPTFGRPRPEEVSRLLEAVYAADPDFAVLLWLAATTGARRGELCALRWSHVDLKAAELVIVRNLIQRNRQLIEKDTKTHAARRIALSEGSAGLLAEHRGPVGAPAAQPARLRVLTAAKLIAETAGVARFRSEACFAMHAGVAPIPVSSGRTDRHRLCRGGNRQLNAAIHRIAITQLRLPCQGQSYHRRRRVQGDRTGDAVRALKRRIARAVYQQLKLAEERLRTTATAT
jgi:Transposase IS116/IS110/IS902 family/Phage integrase family